MPALCPLQPVLGAAPERLKNERIAASPGRPRAGLAGGAGQLKLCVPSPCREERRLTAKVQGRGASSISEKCEIIDAPRPLQPVLGGARTLLSDLQARDLAFHIRDPDGTPRLYNPYVVESGSATVGINFVHVDSHAPPLRDFPQDVRGPIGLHRPFHNCVGAGS
jgi:hypothetical protein